MADARSLAISVGADPLPENAAWKNRMEIRSESSSRLYIVAQRKTDGTWACSCFGWKRYRHCKHLDRMVPMLTAAAARIALSSGR